MTYTGITLSQDDACMIIAQLDSVADRHKRLLEKEKDGEFREYYENLYKRICEARDHLKDECSDAIRRWNFTCEVESLAES